MVEDDLVAARQADRSLSSQDFSRSVGVLVLFVWFSCHAIGCVKTDVCCRLLTMGRLISLSFGETSLTLEHWQMAKELERLRKERLQGSS